MWKYISLPSKLHNLYKLYFADVFETFLLRHHRTEIKCILQNSDDQIHYSLEINFLSLSEEYVEVAEAILAYPERMLPIFDAALLKAITKIYDKENGDHHFSLKLNVHVRLIGLPRYPELYRHSVPHSNDVNRILCLTGTVVRTVSPKMLEYQREYVCMKCKHSFVIKEQPQKLLVGTIPRSIWATLEDDLVDSAKPGDEVLVCGVVLQRWQSVGKGARPSIDLVIKANNLTVHNKQRSGNVVTKEMKEEFIDYWKRFEHDSLTGRNLFLASFCPQVYGLYVVKLAVAMVIAGGIQKIDANGTRTRGESHLLLVGDPGTGKSQFLKYVSNLVPRCVLTTGIGTTIAGLTVSAVREEGEWALEAGALVLADGGICCIDEFNSIREADRAAIHEAMEQQTISVAKAGIVCKLNSRCSILAATNPKGRYDVNESLNINVALASPLLSRFDIILVLLDSRNTEWDKVVSSYILEGKDILSNACEEIDHHTWTLEQLRSYFCYIRTLQPKMTHDAHLILTKYYQLQRQTDERNKARTTIRLLESLVRLSQGHARLLMKDEVSALDAIVAVTLIEASMCGASLIKGGNVLHTSFPSSPVEEYKKQATLILQTLGLLDILLKEMQRLQENKHFIRNKPKANFTSVYSKPEAKAQHVSSVGNNLKRVLLQEATCYSNILEMNDSFVDEESDTNVADAKQTCSKKRKRNKLKKEDSETTRKKDKKDSEPSQENKNPIFTDTFGAADRLNGVESQKLLESPKMPRKYFNRSELKSAKSRKKTSKKDDEDIRSSFHKNRESFPVEKTISSTRESQNQSQNYFLDQSLQKLSQEILEFEDFEVADNSPIYKSRKTFHLCSSPLIKRRKYPLSTNNNNNNNNDNNNNNNLEERVIGVSDINVYTKEDRVHINSKTQVHATSCISESKDFPCETPNTASFYSSGSKEKDTSCSESLVLNGTQKVNLKVDLKRFSFNRNSAKKFSLNDQKSQINNIKDDDKPINITNSNPDITSNTTTSTSTITTQNNESKSIERKNELDIPSSENVTPKISFIEKLKKFCYREEPSRELTTKANDNESLLEEFLLSSNPISKTCKPTSQEKIQNSSCEVDRKQTQLSRASSSNDERISLFDEVDVDLDFDF